MNNRRRSSVKIEVCKSSDADSNSNKKTTKKDNEKIRKIRQMVDFDENSLALSSHQKNVHGIIDEE